LVRMKPILYRNGQGKGGVNKIDKINHIFYLQNLDKT
jgi:hypothetical protein